ncbi:MAG: hypothetical protein PVG94_06175 [Gammaproteobacteria bacterium]
MLIARGGITFRPGDVQLCMSPPVTVAIHHQGYVVAEIKGFTSENVEPVCPYSSNG